MALTTEQQENKDYLDQLTSARADELMPDNAEPLAPYGFIDKELEFGAEFILTRVPRHFVYDAIKDGSGLTMQNLNENDGGRVPLPSDFLRFIRFRLNGWKHPVDSVYDIDETKYRMQRFEMTRATTIDPIVVLVPYLNTDPTLSNKALEVYPFSLGVDEFMYVPKIQYYDMPTSLYDPMVWYACSRILSSLQQPSASKEAFQNMLQLIGGKLIGYQEEQRITGGNQ